jgi:hypothetical protein
MARQPHAPLDPATIRRPAVRVGEATSRAPVLGCRRGSRRPRIREQVATQRRQVFGVEGEEGGLAVVATALWPLILVGASLHLNLGQL